MHNMTHYSFLREHLYHSNCTHVRARLHYTTFLIMCHTQPLSHSAQGYYCHIYCIGTVTLYVYCVYILLPDTLLGLVL